MKRNLHILPTVLVMLIVPPARASRWYQPMSFYVSQAELIVVADMAPEPRAARVEAFSRGVILSVREVLKGERAWVGQQITLRRRHFSTADAYIPLEPSSGIAVLLRPGWQKSEEWPVTEAYLQPEQVSALRVLVPVFTLADERERLAALSKASVSDRKLLFQETLAQIREMRDSNNFDFVTNLYSGLHPEEQIEFVKLIGEIGDPRAVPVLISAATATDSQLRSTALRFLANNYPGAPEVTRVFEKALNQQDSARVAATYLKERKSDPKLSEIAEGPETSWSRARHLLNTGKTNEARAIYLEILRDNQEPDRRRIYASSLLLKDLSEDEKIPIREALVPLATQQGDLNDYIVAHNLAQMLRALRHRDCLPVLSAILKMDLATSSEATWTSAMAIRELGEEARQQAVSGVLERLKLPPKKSVTGSNPARYLLELLWLGTQKNFEEADTVMDRGYRDSWRSLQALREFDKTKDEGAFLIEQLSKRAMVPEDATLWVTYRLRDLKERRATRELVRCLEDTWWWLKEPAGDALAAIGGTEVQGELTRLLAHSDVNGVRRPATEALSKLLGDGGVEIYRRILSENDLGWRPAAYQALSRVGDSSDLQRVTSLANFWSGDRPNHHWAMSALDSLRRRNHYDLNGPIKIAR